MINSLPEKIEPFFTDDDGLTYFRLNMNPGTSCINGSVSVKSNKSNVRTYVLMNESVYFTPKWNVKNQVYYIDGWGNTVQNALPANKATAGNATASVQLSNVETKHTDILLNLLCELADQNGCINEIGLKNALNFVLQFHGILDPDNQNRRKLIYALRRLGYIIENKDASTGKYENQLVAPFVEKTLYHTISNTESLYLIKGVYSSKELEDFRRQNNIRSFQFKRPYEKRRGNLRTSGYCAENDSPEYKCLPDLVFFKGVQSVQKWNCIQSPYAHILLSNIGDMKQFASIFLNGNSSVYSGNHGVLPEMIEDDYHKEVICCKDNTRQLRTWKNYYDSKSQRFFPIPKHLARLYCENEKNIPICIIRNRQQSTEVSFLHKMGIPRVLDMALCDLNLGLPDEHKVFVIDHQNSHLPMKLSANGKNIPYSDIKTYHNISSLDWLKQLSANNRSSQYAPSTCGCWKMYLDKRRIIVTYNDNIFAFSEYGNVFFFDNQNQTYVKVDDNRSVNELLSEMIKNKNSIQGWNIITRCPVTPPTSVTGLIEMDII